MNEATIQTYFGGAIDVVNAEDGTETVQQDFSERRYQLGGSYKHVNTRRPASSTKTACQTDVQVSRASI